MAEISPRVERNVVFLDENATALEAARFMSEHNFGSVVVGSADAIKGLFTERDLMKLVVAAGLNPAAVKVRDIMRRDIPTIRSRESVERCLEMMRDNRTRHLLVYDSSQFVGLISLRDVALLMLDEKERLIQELTRYITT
jgi:CBS domain-containing protein